MEPMRFSDVASSNSTMANGCGCGGKRTSAGFYVSHATACATVVGAALLAIGTGLLVFWAARDHSAAQSRLADAELRHQCGEFARLHDRCFGSGRCFKSAVLTTTKHPVTSVSTTPTPPPSVGDVDVRLPRNLLPVHYILRLRPDIYAADPDDFTLSGSVIIELSCQKETAEIFVHVNQIKVNEGSIAVITKSSASTIVVSSTSYDATREMQKIQLDRMLLAGENITLSMNFSGKLLNNLKGFYWSSYQRNGQPVYLASTQFQPTDGRRAFPCLDEPDMKATFAVSLERMAHFNALSNMPSIKNETLGNGWILETFQGTVKMSTYLLAFVISDFQYIQVTTNSSVQVRVWSRKEAIEQGAYALDACHKILDYFTEYFGIDFPLPKQDMVAIPDFSAGAMENWGLILYRETALLYDSNVSSSSSKQRVAVVVSHELAHQWFGNLVTPLWWDDLWLNEGFASYVEYLGVAFYEPTWKMMQQLVVDDLHTVFSLDALTTSHPIFVPVNHPDEINQIFDSISYAKGASVIRMMNKILGEDTFRKGLSDYLKTFAYRNANHTDLWNSLDKQAKQDGKDISVRDTMNTWILQMGYPVVKADKSGSNLKLSQYYFRSDDKQPLSKKYPSPYGYKWSIPVTYAVGRNINVTHPKSIWMKKTDVVVRNFFLASTNEWLLLNINQVGYYRVNYQIDNWNLLLNQLNEDHTAIPTINRAQILDDSFNLARSGKLDQLIFLRATSYLDKELEYVPWNAADGSFSYLSSMLRVSPSFGNLMKYLEKCIESHYSRFSWTNDTGIGHTQRLMRSIIFSYACTTKHKDCRQKSKELFDQWMANPSTNPIHPDMKLMVYCNAVSAGGEKEWNFALQQYLSSNVASERSILRHCLSCTNSAWILQKYLKMALKSSDIKKQDALYVVINVSYNKLGRYMAWEFVRAEWNTIMKRYGDSFFAIKNLIEQVTSSFNTQHELNELLKFQETNKNNLGVASQTVKQVIEKTHANIAWMKENEEKITNWLKDNV